MSSYGYSRVSTVAQAHTGTGLALQERITQGYVSLQGLTLDHLFSEREVSGFRPLVKRPKVKKLVSLLRPGDTIIIAKLDRMFRSAVNALATCDQWRRQEIRLHMVGLGGEVTREGPSKMLFNLLATMPEAEHDHMSERGKATKEDMRARQRYLGGNIPFSWRLSIHKGQGFLAEHPGKQRVIQHILLWHHQGLPLRTISDKIRQEGHTL